MFLRPTQPKKKPKRKLTPKQKARKLIGDILSNNYEEGWFDVYDEDERAEVIEAYDDLHNALTSGKPA